MKLLQINSVYEILSTGRTSYELEKYLETKGWECHMAYADGTPKSENGIKMGNLNSHRIHSFLARKLGLQGFFSPVATWKLIKYMKRVQPDIVHLRNLHSNYISIIPVLKYLVKKKIPTVITLHDFWLFTGGCCLPMDYECERWKKECKKCPENAKNAWVDMSNYVFRKKINLLRQIPKVSVVGVSEWATEQCSIVNACSNMKKMTIYNWIDFEKFYAKETIKTEIFPKAIADKFLVLGVATIWGAGKGLQDFLELSKMLGEDAQIVLIGTMPKEINLPKNILNIPLVKDVELLAKYYSTCDVFVSMSYRETFGKTIAEAMSCGCPAVVYDVTACGEIVGPGCGNVVEVGNVSAVYDSIMKIKKDTKKAYFENCITHTRRQFDYEKNCEEYRQLYKMMLNEKNDLLEEGTTCME